jgi:hypothetical protein
MDIPKVEFETHPKIQHRVYGKVFDIELDAYIEIADRILMGAIAKECAKLYGQKCHYCRFGTLHPDGFECIDGHLAADAEALNYRLKVRFPHKQKLACTTSGGGLCPLDFKRVSTLGVPLYGRPVYCRTSYVEKRLSIAKKLMADANASEDS